MTRLIALAGKGGVGKTMLAINLALAFRQAGKRALLIDAARTAPHVSLFLDFHPKHFLTDLMDQSRSLHEILYKHPSGIHVVCSTEHERVSVSDPHALSIWLKKICAAYDVVILDTAPAVVDDAFLSCADDLLLVATPTHAAAEEVGRISRRLEQQDPHPRCAGIVLNRVQSRSWELSAEAVRLAGNLPILGIVPYDDAVPESIFKKTPLLAFRPTSSAAKSISKIATVFARPSLSRVI